MMDRRNEISNVIGGVVERLRRIAEEAVDGSIPMAFSKRLASEVKHHEDTLKLAFGYRKKHGPPLGAADSDSYFSEKLSGLVSFVNIAIGVEPRGNYSPDKINENVSHYSFLVAKLLAADWNSRARTPLTETTLRSQSFENRSALERLARR